jgi:hypothetical protein
MSYAFTDDLPDFPGGVAGKSLMHLLGTGMQRIFLALALATLASAGFAQTPPLLPQVTVAALANEVSGETAKRNLEGLARLHRQRGSQGFYAAAELIAERARAYGSSHVEILRFPADGRIFYGTQRSRPAWDAEEGDCPKSRTAPKSKWPATPPNRSCWPKTVSQPMSRQMWWTLATAQMKRTTPAKTCQASSSSEAPVCETRGHIASALGVCLSAYLCVFDQNAQLPS